MERQSSGALGPGIPRTTPTAAKGERYRGREGRPEHDPDDDCQYCFHTLSRVLDASVIGRLAGDL
jgi:hypothetical protein